MVICAACPIYTQHRTVPDLVGTSQLGQKRSFDCFVGAMQRRGRNLEADPFGRLGG